jgi:hypothetical protein
LAAQQDYHSVRLGRNETEDESIFGPTVIAFEYSVTKRRFGVKLDFFVARTDKMVDNMRRRPVATSTAKPFVAGKALDDAAWRMYTAITVWSVNAGAVRKVGKLQSYVQA